MDNLGWIAYHCRAKFDLFDMHYVIFIDAENLEIIGSCTTNVPNFEIIIEMLDDSLCKHSKPRAIYITKHWITELSPHFPKINFKNVIGFPKDIKVKIDKYATEYLSNFLSNGNLYDIKKTTNYE